MSYFIKSKRHQQKCYDIQIATLGIMDVITTLMKNDTRHKHLNATMRSITFFNCCAECRNAGFRTVDGHDLG